jgi:two-component system, sensor histidine kinase
LYFIKWEAAQSTLIRAFFNRICIVPSFIANPMKKTLPFFNWSLAKAIDNEPDSFSKARVRIVYTVLLFSLLKALIVLATSIANDQWRQVARAVIALLAYLVIVKVLLHRPARIQMLAYILLSAGVIIIWTNIFIYAHKVNLLTVQFVFMVSLSSFYTLGSRPGIFYMFISALPIVLSLVFPGILGTQMPNSAQELASPGYEVIVILNFVSITFIHYLFYQAYNDNLKEKEVLNLQLQDAAAAANQLAESRANFLSTMSHELRTPLNSVIGIAELLQLDHPEERQKENLKILQFSALDLLSLINNVLDFNKVDSDNFTLEKVSFNLAEHMRNICAGLQLKAGDKHLEFKLEIDPLLEDAVVASDPTRLSQLVYNLVSNAIKFTEKGRVTVGLKCVNRTGGEVEVLFSVTDTGIGIHPDRHESVFELFTQAESHISRSYGGTGLGLAIVKQVLTLFNSSIELESSPGMGAKFFFKIRFVTSSGHDDMVIPDLGPKSELGHLKIMIAEDNEFNRVIIKKQMHLLHLEPVMVNNGEQALEACTKNQYDVVFIDLDMPVMNGYETIEKIRALSDRKKAATYIIAFTASVTEQERIIKAGFNDFLYKPINLKELENKLEKVAAIGRAN